MDGGFGKHLVYAGIPTRHGSIESASQPELYTMQLLVEMFFLVVTLCAWLPEIIHDVSRIDVRDWFT